MIKAVYTLNFILIPKRNEVKKTTNCDLWALLKF